MANDSASVKDAKTGLDKDIAMYRRDENGNPIYVQQISLVDPSTREAVSMAQEATMQAVLTELKNANSTMTMVDSVIDVDTTPGRIYEYWTPQIGAAASDPVWVVGYYDIAQDAEYWADGNTNADNVVTDIASLTYAQVV